MAQMFGNSDAADAAAAQKKVADEMKAAQDAKEAEANRQRLESMKARLGAGMGVNAGTPGGNPNATG